MAGQEFTGPYGDLGYPDNYLDVPDLTRRLPVHDHVRSHEQEQQLIQLVNQVHHNHEDITLKSYIGSGVAYVSLITENLLSHPFLVLRRQCQVHHNSRRYHIIPFTLIPTICHLHQHQGLSTLWKGLGSVLLVRGLSLGIEDLVSKITPWPKELTADSTLKQFFQHSLLKCVSLALVTPFYSASFVETVQSEIASEKPGILDVFREGFMRLLNWGAPAKGRMLPIWALIIPTVALGFVKYLFGATLKGIVFRLLKFKFRSRCEMNGALPKDLANSAAMQDLNLTATIVATIASDVVFYPCETIVHRLHLQGTRTIVDDLDTGKTVLPILTNYTGAIDCYESCIAQEGVAGLYKGFGAVILQYSAHISLIRISRFILTEIGILLRSPKKKPPALMDSSPPAISNLTESPKSYLLP